MPVTAKKKAQDPRDELFVSLVDELYCRSEADLQRLANRSGLTSRTLYRWMEGVTISPRTCHVVTVAKQLGFNVQLARNVRTPRLQIV